jgi:hypothetical protein
MLVLKKTSRIAMTIIEIRPFPNDWTVFEAPGAEKSFFLKLRFAVSVETKNIETNIPLMLRQECLGKMFIL